MTNNRSGCTMTLLRSLALSALLTGSLMFSPAPAHSASEEQVETALSDLARSESYRLRCRHLITPLIAQDEVDLLERNYERYRQTRIEFIKQHIEEETGAACNPGWINFTNPPCDDMMTRLADKSFELAGFRPDVEQCMSFVNVLRGMK